MFKDGAVSNLKDVVQIRLVSARPRLGEAHVAETPRHLSQVFAGDFGVRLPAYSMIGEEAIHDCAVNCLATDEIDGRFVDDADIPGRIEADHGLPQLYHERESFPRRNV